MTWYAYAVASQRETRVKDTLSELGFGVAVPMEIKMRKRANSRRRMPKAEPLIRGYVFVDIPADLGWWHVLHMRYIISVVGTAGKPIPIDSAWIATVSTPMDIKPSRINFAPGTKVEVVGGPAKGHLAKVIEASGEFAKLCFEGANFPIMVKSEMLEKVG